MSVDATRALEAAQRVGDAGRVVGIDPAPRQLQRARSRAARARVPAQFQLGTIEQLPFEAASFDVVLSTWMMHHLPDDLKRRGLQEIRRVLKTGGRLVVLDGEHPHRGGHRLGMGHLRIHEVAALMRDGGFDEVHLREAPLAPIKPLAHAAGITVGTRAM